ncbi:sigma-70 family RNA polymerase sigma factor [Paenibacillus nanensis]|uniref:Sigma-70 family RNA polymerase sigma factor n=1 Tax=Paenibacillus nanensis TaxID=393251 RepID=A0A3A1ULU1_9BACL|nr:sigma-70 family RNA polymerase sigma factor [Paenibacillus nanensis]RIX45834.1 sigma-70 family RNA polymerase sigma factor [Paenibacillus nanensis]
MKPAGLKNKDNYSNDPAEALEQLMDSYGTIVLRTAFFYMGDRHLAEDISQEVFLRAYRNWPSFRGESTVKTWLTTITVNVCRDKMGVRMFTEQPTDPSRVDHGRTISVEEEALRRMEKSEVLQHVLRLPLPYQEALYLYYYMDFSTSEIAKMTSSPEGTVRNRLYRAREALAREMKKGEETSSDRLGS